MALEVEIWQSQIEQNLFKNNYFVTQSKDASENVVMGKIVHIPNAGTPSGTKKNRSVFPAPITRRSDIDVTYTLDEFTTNPVTIPNIETVQLSYDKTASVLEDDQASLNQNVAESMLQNWKPDLSNIIQTTGANIPASLTTTTGLRKALTVNDFVAARVAMNKQNVPQEGRCCVIPTDMMQGLLLDPSLNNNAYSQAIWLTTGKLDSIAGFKVYERASVLAAAQDKSAIRAIDDDGNLVGVTATDGHMALFWHPLLVERAVGKIEMFSQYGSPVLYGDTFSFLVMAGGRKRRADNKGVIGIAEKVSA